METKHFWQSKIMWVNIIALGAIIYQFSTGDNLFLDPEAQVAILAVLNLILRAVTKQPLDWR